MTLTLFGGNGTRSFNKKLTHDSEMERPSVFFEEASMPRIFSHKRT